MEEVCCTSFCDFIQPWDYSVYLYIIINFLPEKAEEGHLSKVWAWKQLYMYVCVLESERVKHIEVVEVHLKAPVRVRVCLHGVTELKYGTLPLVTSFFIYQTLSYDRCYRDMGQGWWTFSESALPNCPSISKKLFCLQLEFYRAK
jgi:hypothetical protein